MRKLRALMVVFLLAAIAAVGFTAIPTAEAAPVPMLCFLTVYECDTDPGAEHVGAGYNVSAYIEGTTGNWSRAWGLTDANGNVTLQVWASDPELTGHQAVTFKVNGLTATADPAITATLAPQTIRLDFCDGGPCVWVFPHGLDVDPLAVFPRYYDCSTVTLGSLDPGNPAEIPAELDIVWHYKEALTPEWQYFIPGGGGTLLTLVADSIYLNVVDSACTWNIPQP